MYLVFELLDFGCMSRRRVPKSQLLLYDQPEVVDDSLVRELGGMGMRLLRRRCRGDTLGDELELQLLQLVLHLAVHAHLVVQLALALHVLCSQLVELGQRALQPLHLATLELVVHARRLLGHLYLVELFAHSCQLRFASVTFDCGGHR